MVYRKRTLLAFRVLWDRKKTESKKKKHCVNKYVVVINTSSCPFVGKTLQPETFAKSEPSSRKDS